ncbi:transcription factor MYB44-like protein [Tanacetum coccineum]
MMQNLTSMSCELDWLSLSRPEEDELLENPLEKHSLNSSLISKFIPGKSAMACELRWKNMPDLNLSLAVGGVSGHQAPSISDMARENMSSGGTHSYSRDHSAPSWNALNKRDSSPMMIDSYSVQGSVGGKFGSNDIPEQGRSHVGSTEGQGTCPQRRSRRKARKKGQMRTGKVITKKAHKTIHI